MSNLYLCVNMQFSGKFGSVVEAMGLFYKRKEGSSSFMNKEMLNYQREIFHKRYDIFIIHEFFVTCISSYYFMCSLAKAVCVCAIYLSLWVIWHSSLHSIFYVRITFVVVIVLGITTFQHHNNAIRVKFIMKFLILSLFEKSPTYYHPPTPSLLSWC